MWEVLMALLTPFQVQEPEKNVVVFLKRHHKLKRKKKKANNNLSIILLWFLTEILQAFSKDTKGYWLERIFEQQWNICSYFNCNTCSSPELYVLFLEFTAVSKTMTSQIHGNQRMQCLLCLSLKAKLDFCRLWSSPCWLFSPALLSFFLPLLALLSHIG